MRVVPSCLVRGVVAQVVITIALSAGAYEVQELNRGSLFTTASLLHDADSDGDLDVLITVPSSAGGEIDLLVNDGTDQFPRRMFYRDASLQNPADIDLCDCDNDGDTDFVIAEGSRISHPGQLFVLERQANGSLIKWTVEAGIDVDRADVADFNRDGRLDIVAVGFEQRTVNIYLNQGGFSFTKRTLAADVSQVTLVEADDIDGDGDVDVVFSGWLYRNRGDATFEAGQPLYTWSDLHNAFGSGLAVVDLNRDGRKDILTFSSFGTGGLYFLDGARNFDQSVIERVAIDNGGDIRVADLDGNGLPDIVRQHFVENFVSVLYQDQPMQFRSVVIESRWDNTVSSTQMAIGDLDGDADLDIVFPEAGNIDEDLSWFENINGQLFKHQLYGHLVGARIVKAGDLDGDGDLDVVATIAEDIIEENEVVWYENRGASGFVQWRIADGLDYPADVELADLDGDGRLDVIVTARDDHDVLWFKRNGPSWTPRVIEENGNSPLGADVVDLDRDGDIDVLMASSGDAKVFWYANDGAGNFQRRVVDSNLANPREVAAADLDRDGDIDVAVASSSMATTVAIYLNDGQQNFSRQSVAAGFSARDLDIGDFDRDGTPEVVVAYYSTTTADPDIVRFEHTGGTAFATTPIITTERSVTSVHLADTDRDGDLDLLYGRDEGLSGSTPLLRIITNNGGQPGPALDLLGRVTGTISGIDVADVDGDGKADVLAADFRFDRLLLFTAEDASRRRSVRH